MKNKGLILTLVTLTSLFVVGCENNSSPSFSSFDVFSTNDKQALINRVIYDYYQQKMSKSGFITIEQNEQIINVINDGINWERINSLLPYAQGPVKGISLENCSVSIIGISDSGAYVCSFNNTILPFSSSYQYDYSVSTYLNGEKASFYSLIIPLVWYKGEIQFISEAYLNGLLEISDINNQANVNNNDKIFNSYDESIPLMKITNDSRKDSEKLSELKIDYFTYISKTDCETITGQPLKLSDVHLIHDFGKIGEYQMVIMGCDNLLFTQPVWSDDLVFDAITISPFTRYEPSLYINHSFYSITDAFYEGLIDINSIKTIKESFR